MNKPRSDAQVVQLGNSHRRSRADREDGAGQLPDDVAVVVELVRIASLRGASRLELRLADGRLAITAALPLIDPETWGAAASLRAGTLSQTDAQRCLSLVEDRGGKAWLALAGRADLEVVHEREGEDPSRHRRLSEGPGDSLESASRREHDGAWRLTIHGLQITRSELTRRLLARVDPLRCELLVNGRTLADAGATPDRRVAIDLDSVAPRLPAWSRPARWELRVPRLLRASPRPASVSIVHGATRVFQRALPGLQDAELVVALECPLSELPHPARLERDMDRYLPGVVDALGVGLSPWISELPDHELGSRLSGVLACLSEVDAPSLRTIPLIGVDRDGRRSRGSVDQLLARARSSPTWFSDPATDTPPDRRLPPERWHLSPQDAAVLASRWGCQLRPLAPSTPERMASSVWRRLSSFSRGWLGGGRRPLETLDLSAREVLDHLNEGLDHDRARGKTFGIRRGSGPTTRSTLGWDLSPHEVRHLAPLLSRHPAAAYLVILRVGDPDASPTADLELAWRRAPVPEI